MDIETKFQEVLNMIKAEEAAYTRIAVVGQPGAGKSSLINNLLGKKVAEVGIATDTTKEVTEYDFHFMKILDTPGYGTESFTFPGWKWKFHPEKFDVIVYVFSGKFEAEDDDLFDELKKYQKPTFLVRNHSTGLCSAGEKKEVSEDLRTRYGNYDKLYFVSCGREKEGIDELRNAILTAELQNEWQKRITDAFYSARDTYLRNAKEKAESDIGTYKTASAANGLNPIPGLDIGVDLGIYFKMFADIRQDYGIDEKDFGTYMAVPIANKLLGLLTKEGVLLLLKSFGTRFAAKSVLRYIPLVGQASAAMLGWMLCEATGDSYSQDCYSFAWDVMDRQINKEISAMRADAQQNF